MDGIEEQEMKGVIYKLYSDEGNMVYIGSTLDFKKRMRGHARLNKGCNSKFLFKYYGTVKVVKLEERNFMNREEMLELELKYINDAQKDENVKCVNGSNPLNPSEYFGDRVYVNIDVKGMADEYEAYKKMKDSKVVNFKEECSFYEMVDGKCFDLKSYYTCEYCNVLVPYLARHCETERHKMAKMMVENGKSITVDVKDEVWIDENGITIDIDVEEMDDGWKERLKVMDENGIDENGIEIDVGEGDVKGMDDVRDGIVYKMYSDEGNMVYIGSTVRTLNERFEKHRKRNNKCSSKYLFKFYKNVKIMELERMEVKDVDELHKLEMAYIEACKGDVNVWCVNVRDPVTNNKLYGFNIPKYVRVVAGKFVYERRYQGFRLRQQLSGSSVERSVDDKYREMMCRYADFVENGLMDKMKKIDERVASA